MNIQHYSTCRADYPEKTEGEEAKACTRIPLEDNKVVMQCNDCGAFEIIKED